MKLFKYIKGLFSVYNEYTDTDRVSREMVGTVVAIGIGVVGLFSDIKIDGQTAAALTSLVFGAIGLFFRVTSKGGESLVKPSVREKIETKKAIKESLEQASIQASDKKDAKNTFMPELPGD